MPNGLIRLATALAAAGISAPVFGDRRNADGSERLISRCPARVHGVRAAGTGTVQIMGADLKNPGIGEDAQLFIGDGTTVAFTSELDYVAPSKDPLNWVLVRGLHQRVPTILTGAGAAASGVDVGVTDSSGKALFTVHADDTPDDGEKFGVFFLTAEELLAAVGTTEHSVITTRDLMWCEGTGATVSSTDVWLEALAAAGS